MEFKQDSVFTKKVSGGRKRIYFIDVKQTKSDDYYLVLTESAKRKDGRGYDRHKIFLYKEDLNRFLGGITEAVDKIKELMPEHDFNKFDRRYEENNFEGEESQDEDNMVVDKTDENKSSDDISW